MCLKIALCSRIKAAFVQGSINDIVAYFSQAKESHAGSVGSAESIIPDYVHSPQRDRVSRFVMLCLLLSLAAMQ